MEVEWEGLKGTSEPVWQEEGTGTLRWLLLLQTVFLFTNFYLFLICYIAPSSTLHLCLAVKGEVSHKYKSLIYGTLESNTRGTNTARAPHLYLITGLKPSASHRTAPHRRGRGGEARWGGRGGEHGDNGGCSQAAY